MGPRFEAAGPFGPVWLELFLAPNPAVTADALTFAGTVHPAWAQLLDHGAYGDRGYLAFEPVVGVTLLDVRRAGSLALEPLVELGVQLCDALAALHRVGLAHGAISLDRVVVQVDGRARLLGPALGGASRSTTGFFAPEQLGGHPASPASDEFALGRLLFELGAKGEAGDPRAEPDWPRLPTYGRWPELVRTLGRMLEQDPRDRFSDLSAVAGALSTVREDNLAPDTLASAVQQLADPASDDRLDGFGAPGDLAGAMRQLGEDPPSLAGPLPVVEQLPNRVDDPAEAASRAESVVLTRLEPDAPTRLETRSKGRSRALLTVVALGLGVGIGWRAGSTPATHPDRVSVFAVPVSNSTTQDQLPGPMSDALRRAWEQPRHRPNDPRRAYQQQLVAEGALGAGAWDAAVEALEACLRLAELTDCRQMLATLKALQTTPSNPEQP